MLKYLMALLVCVFVSAPVHGQTQDQQKPNVSLLRMNAVLPCDSYENILSLILDKHQETRFAEGKGIMQLSTGQFLEGKIEFYLKKDMSSFTVVFTNGEIACMVVNGRQFQLPGSST